MRSHLHYAAALVSTAFLAGAAPQPAGVTLSDCYQRARQISETLRISDQEIQRIQSQYHSALGSVFPHVYWIKSQEYQDTSANPAAGDSTVGRSLTRSPIPLSYFQLQQPLFAGGKDWQAVRIAKSAESQARFNRQQADLQLLAEVATAFYTASSVGNQLTVLGGLHKLTEERVKELRHFVEVGRSRQAEVLSAQTQLASLEAQIEDLKRAYAQSRHTLLFLTGVPAEVPLNDASLAAPSRGLDEALLQAGSRPDIQATMEVLKQADLYIRYAKGSYWPKLSLTANSYTERTGFLSDVRWDATFLLNVPIFEGGSTRADVQVARAQQIVAQLTLARLKRDAERQVRTAYDNLQHTLSQVQAYSRAVALSEENYRVQNREYRQGLINNLELLQLLNALQSVKQQAAAAGASAKLSDVLFRISMGDRL